MRPFYLLIAAALATGPSVAFGQEADQSPPERAQPAPRPFRTAIERPHRVAAPGQPAESQVSPGPGTQTSAVVRRWPTQINDRRAGGQNPTTLPAAAAEQQRRRAVPRGSRPQGENPRTGRAVPRDAAPAPAPRGRTRGGYVTPPRAYEYYYYPAYPRRYAPYGYGAFGLGYFYYDPYLWSYGAPGYYGAYASPGYAYDIGELRLRVTPRRAEVRVDGYYAGIVDDYDGTFQALRLESGPHHVEIVAPGYAPLAFEVHINPGQKVTYRGDLPRLP